MIADRPVRYATAGALVPPWLLWMIATLALWGVWGALLRLAPVDLSAAQCQAFSTVGMLPVLLLLAFTGEGLAASSSSRSEVLIALAGGAVSCLGNIAFYAALAKAPAAVVVPLTAMSPAVAVVLAAVFLRERIGPLQWAGTALSLVAILLFNRTEGDGGDSTWLLLALVPLVLWGVTLLMQKLATRTLPGGVAAWWFLAAFVPVGAAILVAEPVKSDLSLRTWAVVAALGFTLGLGNVTLMRALSSGGRASVVAPLSGLYPLVSVPLAIGFLGERLDAYQLLGVVVALGAVWLLSQDAGAPDAPGTKSINSLTPGQVRDEALP